MNHPKIRVPAAAIAAFSALTAFAALLSAAAYAQTASGYELKGSVMDNGGGEYSSGGEYLSKGSLAQVALPDDAGGVTGGGYSNQAGFYDPPHITFQSGVASSFRSATGDLTLSIPAGAINKEGFEVTLNRNPVGSPVNVDPAKISSANDKMVFNEGQWAAIAADSLVEISIFDTQDYYSGPFAGKGLLTMRYADADDDGILDGSNPPVRVDTLNTWVLDEAHNSWVRVPAAGVDKVQKTMSVYFAKAGVYALIGALDQSVDDVSAYPVPFRPHGPRAGSGQGQTGSESQGIVFVNLPQSGKIDIYTLDGRLVRSIVIPDNLGSQTLSWDVKNSSGQKAASGVYIWRVVSGGNAKTGKLMVIW